MVNHVYRRIIFLIMGAGYLFFLSFQMIVDLVRQGQVKSFKLLIPAVFVAAGIGIFIYCYKLHLQQKEEIDKFLAEEEKED